MLVNKNKHYLSNFIFLFKLASSLFNIANKV